MMIKKKAVILVLFGILLVSSLSLMGASEVGTLATVTVKPAYDLSIEIEILNDVVLQGEDLSVFVELGKENLGSISEEISVNLNYEIIKGNRVVESGFLQTVSVLNVAEVTVEVPTPSYLRGGYVLRVIASNPQSNSDEDGDKFRVRRFFRVPFLNFLFNLV